MNWLARVFASAIVRRVAYIVVGAVLLVVAQLFGMTDAYAQDRCGSSQIPAAQNPYSSQSEAMAACQSAPDPAYDGLAGGGWFQMYSGKSCEVDGSRVLLKYATRQSRNFPDCDYQPVPPEDWGSVSREYLFTNQCSVLDPPLSGGYMQCGDDTANSCSLTTCSGGCTYLNNSSDGWLSGFTVDGRFWASVAGWTPIGATCVPGSETPGTSAPPTDSDGDGTSDGFDPAPNNPGEGGGGGEDGDGVGEGQDGSQACGGEGQPECNSDGSNFGSGQGNTSGGGGNCQTPPSSSGDAILAQIAYQTWATRCAIEGQGQGGSGIGSGIGDGATEGTLQGIKDYLDGKGQGLDEVDDPWLLGVPGEPSDWNMGLGAGSCPAPISTTISFGGASAPIEFSFQPLCDLAGLLRSVFMALGALLSAYIISGVRR